MPDELVKCPHCGKDRPADEFVTRVGKSRKQCAVCSGRRIAFAEANRELCRERNRKHYEQNREAILVKARAYRQAHLAKTLEANRIYHKTHREELALARRLFSQEHPGVNAERTKRWQKSHPEQTRALWSNRDARRRGAEGKHSPAEIKQLHEQQGGRCEACRKRLITKGKGKFHIDHMVPLSRGGSNDIANIQLLCPSCNLRKHAIPYDEWCSRLGKLPFLVSKAS